MTVDRKFACITALRTGILSRQLAPGSELDEVQLAQAHGLSRTPLREILQTLSGEGYITQERHRGARVAPMDIDRLRALLRSGPVILGSVARLATATATTADIDTLTALQAQLSQATEGDDPATATLADHAFHTHLGQVAADPYITAALGRVLLDHSRLNASFFAPDIKAGSKKDRKLIRKALQTHDALITALEAHAPEAAAEAALARWAVTREQITRFLSPEPLPLAGLGD